MKPYVLDWDKYIRLAQQTVAEGCVLLKNENHTLPFDQGEVVSVFGRSQLNYYKSGTGSGGMVNAAYVRSILDGLRRDSSIKINKTLLSIYHNWVIQHPFCAGEGWGKERWAQDEMPLTLSTVQEAASCSDAAIVIIGRTAGEDRDNQPLPGSYYLTSEEENMLELVCANFSRVAVILNVGNIIDMNFVSRYNPGAVMYVWQGGMEGGYPTADLITGKCSPCGKLSDTIAVHLSDYPSDSNFGQSDTDIYAEDVYVGYRYFETFHPSSVLYPFGFGLSYTTFSVNASARLQNSLVTIHAEIQNTGSVSGKEVFQVYCSKPQAKLGTPLRELIDFQKTDLLLPTEKEQLSLEIPLSQLASYDDSGITGFKSCYVLEKGTYRIYAGTDVRSAELLFTFDIPKTTAVRQLAEAMAPAASFMRFRPAFSEDHIELSYESVPTKTVFASMKRLQALPASSTPGKNMGYTLSDVANKKITMETFLDQLSDDDLCHLVHGEGMCSPRVTPGTAAAFGGVTERLSSFGIPAGCCADGPSGMRLECGTNAFSLPNGTLLACTFNPDLVSDLFEMEGLEMRNNHVDALLGPGMNIHRHPLNGRNFEYFSEDPLLTGKIAYAELEGLNRAGVTGVVKHFCANNREHRRLHINSVVSERALREIYLKGFEIALKAPGASAIMTTYGAVNGLWTAGNYDLLTQILRQEWDFDGIVMTDWWAQINDEGEKPSTQNLSAMIRAQNDLYMVVSDAEHTKDNLLSSLSEGTLTRGELLRSAYNICNFLLHTPAMARMLHEDFPVKLINPPKDQVLTTDFDMEYIIVDETAEIDLTAVQAMQGRKHTMALNLLKHGVYKISLFCETPSSALAQMNVSLTDNSSPSAPLAVFAFRGGQEKISMLSQSAELFSGTHYMNLFFAQGGLKVQKLVFTKTDDLNDRI